MLPWRAQFARIGLQEPIPSIAAARRPGVETGLCPGQGHRRRRQHHRRLRSRAAVDRCLGSRRHAIRHLAIDGGQPTQWSPGALPAQILSAGHSRHSRDPRRTRRGESSGTSASHRRLLPYRRLHHLATRLAHPYSGVRLQQCAGNNKGIPYSSRYSKGMAAPSQEFAAYRLGRAGIPKSAQSESIHGTLRLKFDSITG